MKTARQHLKGLLMSAAPRLTTTLLSIRSRRLNQRVWLDSGLADQESTLATSLNFTVLSGPFKGMRLPHDALREHLGPVLLGTYEMELHPSIERLIDWQPQQVLDVGAKIGYYAVGFAMRLPRIPVVAFDTDPWAVSMVRKTARINQQEHVRCTGFCSPEWLQRNINPRSLIISDCEGFELDLFPASLMPALVSSALVIETHDHLGIPISETLRARFEPTHEAIYITSRERTPEDWAALQVTYPGLSSNQPLALLNEFRARQTWIVLVPRF